jgi:hypothetical protein
MSHLAPDELIDAIEETLAPERRAHLHACDRCRTELAQLANALHTTRSVDVPDPSPLFWDHFSDRVRMAIAVEAPKRPRLARWFHWPVLAPLAAVSLLVLALASAVPAGSDGIRRAQLALSGATGVESDSPLDAETHWEVLAELIGELDFETAEAAVVVAHHGSADRAVLQLTTGEQEELVRLLREELQRTGG